MSWDNSQDNNRDSRTEVLAELGEIASRMAHEIRNPLNAIRMQVAVIRNKLMKPDPQNLEVARGQLERLEAEVMRVEKLAKAFLEFGRPPVDEPEDFCLCELIEDVFALIGPEVEQAGHRVELNCRSDHDLWVHMDRSKMRQVLLNLLSNARVAMSEPGCIRIRVDREGPHHARIGIEDTGCGIAPEHLSEIFLPFHAFSSAGAGLGLAIAKKIIDSAGGTITVRSELGKGTCFDIILPLAEVAVA